MFTFRSAENTQFQKSATSQLREPLWEILRLTDMILGAVFLVIIVCVYLFLSKKKETKTVVGYENQSTNNVRRIADHRTLYKTKGIKTFEMRGMYYANLDTTFEGDFRGFAQCDINSHDQYSVAVFNADGYRLGYLPRGNKRMHDSLEEWHNGQTQCWGRLEYDDYDDKWYGVVNIPVGLSESQLASLDVFFSLRHKNEELLSNKERTVDECLTALENHKQIKEIISSLGKTERPFYSFPKTVLPGLSGSLERKKEWQKLILLEEYDDLINELSENYKRKLLERIEIAKQNLP